MILGAATGEDLPEHLPAPPHLGNAFEHDVIDAARRLLSGGGLSPHHGYLQALLASPGYSIRGGASEVQLSLIARQETR